MTVSGLEIQRCKKSETNKLKDLVRKRIVKNKSFDQNVDECESTPEEIRSINTQLLAEFQIRNTWMLLIYVDGLRFLQSNARTIVYFHNPKEN